MKKVSNENAIIRWFFGLLSDKNKKIFLKLIKFQDKTSKTEQIKRKITHCQYCNSTGFGKNGKVSGFQRFICTDHRKAFCDKNQIVFCAVKKGLLVCRVCIHCKIERCLLQKIAKFCEILTSTVFVWRWRILASLQGMHDEVKFDGVAETDEFFLLLNSKVHHGGFNLPHLIRHITRCGLSRRQIFVFHGVNLGDLSVSKATGLSRSNIYSANQVPSSRIARDIVLVADGFRVYSKLSCETVLNRVGILHNKCRLFPLNVQTIDGYPSHSKSMLIHNFKAVSTKYLNNCLVYNNFVSFANSSKNDKEWILVDHIINTNVLAS